MVTQPSWNPVPRARETIGCDAFSTRLTGLSIPQISALLNAEVVNRSDDDLVVVSIPTTEVELGVRLQSGGFQPVGIRSEMTAVLRGINRDDQQLTTEAITSTMNDRPQLVSLLACAFSDDELQRAVGVSPSIAEQRAEDWILHARRFDQELWVVRNAGGDAVGCFASARVSSMNATIDRIGIRRTADNSLKAAALTTMLQQLRQTGFQVARVEVPVERYDLINAAFLAGFRLRTSWTFFHRSRVRRAMG